VELPDDGAIGINKQAVVSNEGDIRYIHLKPSFVSTFKDEDFFGSNLFYLLMIFSVCIWLVMNVYIILI
jgi:hypothetical protein